MKRGSGGLIVNAALPIGRAASEKHSSGLRLMGRNPPNVGDFGPMKSASVPLSTVVSESNTKSARLILGLQSFLIL
jgi:hypothetical protein